jgi:hypothetical protein
MIEKITFTDVKQCILKQFPELSVYVGGRLPHMYLFFQESVMGYFVVIKVPDNSQKGKAIHVSVQCKIKLANENCKVYNVYPSEKKGRGHFTSKSIPRTKNWRISLTKEIQTGIDIYRKKYKKEF